MQAGAGIVALRGEIACHGLDVFHEPRDIREGGTAQPLQDIAAAVGLDEIGAVDVPRAVAFAAQRRAVQAKAGQNLFHMRILPFG